MPENAKPPAKLVDCYLCLLHENYVVGVDAIGDPQIAGARNGTGSQPAGFGQSRF